MQRLLRYLGRVARPVLHPDWDEERRMLRELRARVDALGTLPDSASRQALELKELRERIDTLAHKELHHLRKHTTDLRRAVFSHTQITARALRQAGVLDEQAAHERALQRVIDRARRTGRPLLVGPWTGEVGFEVLYWIPFLRKLRSRLPDPPPFHVVSRGGAAPWYDGLATTYQDAFTLVTPAEFRAGTDRENRKQRALGAFDRRLIRAAGMTPGQTSGRTSPPTRPILVHPSLMYNLLYRYWKDQLPVRRLFDYLEPARLAAPSRDLLKGLELPERYVAVRFYFSQAFPDSAGNRDLVRDIVGRLASRGPVVVLNPPIDVDDHRDAVAGDPRAIDVSRSLTPDNNLAVQSAIIAGAQRFVGTYGGFSYVAPLYGVPSVTFYSDRTFFEQHLEFARRTFAAVGAAPFVVLHAAERALLSDFA